MKEVFLHSDARCESRAVGRGTRVWAFAHVLPGAVIGEDCNICDHTFIENDVVLGDRVTIKCGVQIWDGVRLEDDVFVGPNATFTNDRAPRSRQHPDEFLCTHVREGASIGANATILPGLEIGRNAMVGAGAVVTRSVPPNAIVVGNPARIQGYVAAGRGPERELEETAGAVAGGGTTESQVAGVAVVPLPSFEDIRGQLAAAEVPAELPFRPRRVFFVYGVPSAHVRGEHAHRECEQLLFCVSGSVRVMVDDGRSRQEFLLESPRVGLRIAPMVWAAQYRFSPDAVLVVLASDAYDDADYIRDFDDWCRLRAADDA